MEKEELGMKSLKWLSKIGTARKSKTKRRRKTGKRKTRWKGNGMRMRSWRRFWNEEGWKEALCRQKVPELVVHERMSHGEEVKCTKEKKEVEGSSTEEMKDKANSLFWKKTQKK